MHTYYLASINLIPFTMLTLRMALVFQLQEGSEVQIFLDWPRRFDHMQQHTMEHLLSRVVQDLTKAESVSWEMKPADTVTDPFNNTVEFLPRTG